jgi:hypothetical protein
MGVVFIQGRRVAITMRLLTVEEEERVLRENAENDLPLPQAQQTS